MPSLHTSSLPLLTVTFQSFCHKTILSFSHAHFPTYTHTDTHIHKGKTQLHINCIQYAICARAQPQNISCRAALIMQTKVKHVGRPNDLKGISILHIAQCSEHRMQHNTKPTALPLHLLPQNHISATSLNYLRPQQHQLVTSFAIESANKYN